MDNEEKYPDIREKLKNLEQMKAGDDFVNKLHLKIVELEAKKRAQHESRYDEGRGGFLRNFFGNMQYPWLVPAAGFTVVLFFVFYITYLNKNTSQNLTKSEKTETGVQKNSEVPGGNTNNPSLSDTVQYMNKSNGKDIAGDFKNVPKQKNELAPVDPMTRSSDRDARENYDKFEKTYDVPEPKKEVKQDAESYIKEESNLKDEIIKSPAQEKERSTDDIKSKTEADQSGVIAPQDSESTNRSILSAEKKKQGRLKEKIDSLSKIDLDKLRKEILK